MATQTPSFPITHRIKVKVLVQQGSSQNLSDLKLLSPLHSFLTATLTFSLFFKLLSIFPFQEFVLDFPLATMFIHLITEWLIPSFRLCSYNFTNLSYLSCFFHQSAGLLFCFVLTSFVHCCIVSTQNTVSAQYFSERTN